jgi:6-phosphogluconate dehydrogenase
MFRTGISTNAGRSIPLAEDNSMFIIVTGVSGSGKTTIGAMVARRLGCPFYEGDDFHSPANVTKMAAGIPLTDEDRADWLGALADVIRDGLSRGECGVIACSALKQKYRDVLRVDPERVKFIFLKGDFETIRARMKDRKGHFMKASMLHSQFDTLEEPANALIVDIASEPDEIVDTIMKQITAKKYALGLLGLGVMGRSLALNFERNGYPVIGYDLAPNLPAGFNVSVAASLGELVSSLEIPRIILMMIPAGAPVDKAIESLKPYLEPGDTIIDGGNSYFLDTERRVKSLEADGFQFVGMGVSGGESGALRGPSLMPGGSKIAWPRIMPMLRSIAAVADDGEPCVAWMGPGGAGHYVKMVHNGIEYGDMELIAEIYDLLHRGAGLSNAELADIFAAWNEGELRSYLIEITAEVLRQIDEDSGEPLVNLIMDIAGQKGTGRWTSQIALEVGSPIPTINAAVVVRLISAVKEERVAASKVLGSATTYSGDASHLIAAAQEALYACKITAYAQGVSLLRAASQQHDWNLDFASIVRIWRAGCIIRAALLDDIAAAFERQPQLPNLLLDPVFAEAMLSKQAALREVVQTAAGLGIPLLAIGASLGYFDAYRSERLPANLIQAQRDYFGAHTYHRIDKEGVFHTDWGDEGV